MFMQALEARSISVARARTAPDALKLVNLLHPALLMIDASISDAFVAINHAWLLGTEVIVMSDSDVVLNRARSLGITRTVLKGEGWDTVMDAATSFFGDHNTEVRMDRRSNGQISYDPRLLSHDHFDGNRVHENSGKGTGRCSRAGCDASG
jgi:hypothetical protein